MADETVNGELFVDRSVEITGDDASSKISTLTGKIADLEREYRKVLGENEAYKQQVEELKVAIQDLKKDNGNLKETLNNIESDTRVLKDVAARAADLEAEVSRLQHDLASTMSDLHESTAELSNLKKELDGAAVREKVKDGKLKVVQNERDILQSRVAQMFSVESGLRDELEGKDKEIQSLKNIILEVEGSLESSKSLSKLKAELETTIDSMRERIATLENNLKEKESLIDGFELKHKTLANGDGLTNPEKKGLIGGLGQKQWVLIGGSTAAAVAVMGIVCYMHAAKKH